MELYMHKSSPFRRTRATCEEAAVKYQAHRIPCMFRAREIDPHTQNLLVLTRLFWVAGSWRWVIPFNYVFILICNISLKVELRPVRIVESQDSETMFYQKRLQLSEGDVSRNGKLPAQFPYEEDAFVHVGVMQVH